MARRIRSSLAESLANPGDAKLKAQVDTVFKGTTLRGLLLNAYAFWQIGQIALYPAIAAFAGASSSWPCPSSASCTCAARPPRPICRSLASKAPVR